MRPIVRRMAPQDAAGAAGYRLRITVEPGEREVNAEGHDPAAAVSAEIHRAQKAGERVVRTDVPGERRPATCRGPVGGASITEGDGSNTLEDLMRVTTKGQVTIPVQVRQQMGIAPGSEVEIVAKEGHAEIRLVSGPQVGIRAVLDRMRGAAGPGMTTDEVMELTRGEPG